MNFSKKYESLVLKYQSTSIEREIHEEMFEIAKRDFKVEFEKLLEVLGPEIKGKVEEQELKARRTNASNQMPEHHTEESQQTPPEANLPPSDELLPPLPEDSEESPRPSSIPPQKEDKYKNLFRKLAIMLHPDKLTGEKEKDRTRKTRLFTILQSAMNAGDFGTLLSIALKMDVFPENIGQKDIDLVGDLINKEEDKISFIVASYAWQWYTAKTEKEKEEWMYRFFEIMTKA